MLLRNRGSGKYVPRYEKLGRGFESQHRILDGHFILNCCKIYFLFEKTENKQKRECEWQISVCWLPLAEECLGSQ